MKKIIILIAVVAVLAIVGINYTNQQGTNISQASEATDNTAVNTTLDVEATKESAKKKNIKRTVPDDAVDVEQLIYGEPNAPIIIEEFASLTCSHCANFHRQTLPKLKEALLNNGLAQLHMYSFVRNAQDVDATALIQCQDSNDSRKKFANAILRSQEQWAMTENYRDGLKTIARVGGMSEEEFEACLSDESLQNKIISSRQWFDKQVGVNATPYFRVGGEVVKGAQGIAEFEAAIQAELAK